MLEGLPGNTFEQHLAVQTSAIMHDRCRHLLSLIEASGGLVILENPPSSMTFLDELMLAWLHAVAPFGAQAFACRFGMNWKKRWLFMSNHPSIHDVGLDCCHDKSSHAHVAGVRLADGSWLTQKTAEYPVALAEALATIILPWVSQNGELLQLHNWEEALPPKLTWMDHPARIEDGGLSSTARHIHPIGPDRFQLLRKQWLSRLCDEKWPYRILVAMQAQDQLSPLTETALTPFLKDVLEIFGLEPSILDVTPGQPFRLRLWEFFAGLWDDPELPLFPLPLGVDEPLLPSRAWPAVDATLAAPPPLEHWDSAYSSVENWSLPC